MSDAARRVVVTGGTGFIGRHLIPRLASSGFDVHVTARTQGSEQAAPVESDVTIHPGVDITNMDAVGSVLREIAPDIVFHLAAAGVASPRHDLVALTSVNVLGTANVLEAARGAGVDRAVHVSTGLVAGDMASLNRNGRLSDAYVATKCASEILALHAARTAPTQVVIARLFPVYGPDEPSGRLIPDVIIHGLRDQTVELREPAHQRSYLHVTDAISGIEAAGIRALPSGTVVSLGGTEPVRLDELVERILSIVGGGKLLAGGDVSPLGAQALLPDLDAAHRLLGWRPTIELDEGLRRMVRWYRDHPAMWQEASR